VDTEDVAGFLIRFRDEFVRHKILDIVGDILLLGKPLKAHIVAVRPGHKLNSELTKRLYATMMAPVEPKALERVAPARSVRRTKILGAEENQIYIRRILDILPHTYPFVLIDRVVEFINDDELRAIKNVTINEPFFQGHFPGNPVMPGVLQLESMAQASGILMLRRVSSEGKVAFFMSADNVKFRRAVVPGDQLELHAKITKNRKNRIASSHVKCFVDGKMVSSADLTFTVLDVPEEGM
ncbi:MAG: 3-hydroxyacyl-ACP dehydratase FabZ, partial [Verrucomicrobiota bacterium]